MSAGARTQSPSSRDLEPSYRFPPNVWQAFGPCS